MPFCSNCGKEVEEGQICSCRIQDASEETSASSEQGYSPNYSQNYSQGYELKGIIPTLIGFFTNPATAVRDAVKSNSWKNGLVFIIIYVLITGLFGTFSNVSYDFKSYDSSIKTAQKIYDDYKSDYKKESNDDYMKKYYEESMNKAKKSLDDAKSEKTKLLTSGDFYKDNLKVFWNLILNPILYTGLLILSLFIIGKVLNANSSFTNITAGVGISTNIYLISVIVIPLIAKLPKMDFLTLLIPVITYIFAVLIFIAIDELFQLDNDKSVFSILIAFTVTTFICGLVLKNSSVGSSMNQLNSLLNMFN